jgi:hypothetical protein
MARVLLVKAGDPGEDNVGEPGLSRERRKRMKRLTSTCLAVSAIALIAPRPASAAALIIDDTAVGPTMTFSLNDFEGGFILNGTLVQQGINNPVTITVPEVGTAGGPVVQSFSADWITGGLTPAAGVIAFQEGSIPVSQGVSDILTFTYSVGALGGHLVGTFESDLDPGLLPLPPGATVVAEGTPFSFNNGNITASAISDVDAAVPEPATLTLLGSALLGFGFLRFRRKTG